MNSRTTVHTTGLPVSGALPPFLDQNAVEAALKYILGNWPNNAPMTAAQKEAWVDVLCQFRQGELKEALARRLDDKSHRPEPYAILDIVLGMRTAIRRSASTWKPPERAEKSLDPREHPAIIQAREALAKAKGAA